MALLLYFVSCASFRVAPRFSAVGIEIAVNIFVLYFSSPGLARYPCQKDIAQKTKPTHCIVEDGNLASHAGRHTICTDRLIGNAVLVHVAVGGIPYFVQMVRVRVLEGVAVHDCKLNGDGVRSPSIGVKACFIDKSWVIFEVLARFPQPCPLW